MRSVNSAKQSAVFFLDPAREAQDYDSNEIYDPEDLEEQMEPTFLSQSNMSEEVNIRMSESVVDRIKLETSEERLLNTEQELI